VSIIAKKSIKEVNTMPTFTEIISSVSQFIADYAVFFAAGTVVTLMIMGAKKLSKGGR